MLEDQLYEADYHNRVLRDKLKQARIEASEVQVHSASPAQGKSSRVTPDTDNSRPPMEPSPDPRSDQGDSPDSVDEMDLDDLIPPTFDEGDPIDPKALRDLDDVE